MSWHVYHALKDIIGNGLHDAAVGEKLSRVHLHIVPPHAFKPTPGAINVLFSMWEGSKLPDHIAASLRLADICLVPSRYCQEVWKAHEIDSVVVPLGINPLMIKDSLTPLESGQAIGALFVGSTLPRKGWWLLGPATKEAFKPEDNVTVYLKTIGANQELFTDGSNYLDTRDLSYGEMRNLYWDSEIFMFPSYGEGFGLPVLEAMASGCIVASTDAGGLADFVTKDNAIIIARPLEEEIDYGVKFLSNVPTIASVATALRRAVDLVGTEAGEDMRRNAVATARALTWGNCAESILGALHGLI